MALSVRKIFDRIKNKYRLSLLAGSLGLSRTVSWVYYSEDSSTVDYIRGGEIAITLGVFWKDTAIMFAMMKGIC